MFRFVIQRLLQGLVVLLVLYTLSFFLIKTLPGDAFTGERAISPEAVAVLKKRFGLDKNWVTQYGLRLKRLVVQQDLGVSPKKNREVALILRQSFPPSVLLGLNALLVACAIGIPLGILSAVRKNTWFDYAAMGFAMIGICVAAFIIGPLLQTQIAMRIPALKVAGWENPLDWILPAITLGLAPAAYLARLTRGGMLEILNQDFVRTARAKGVPPMKVITRHTLRGGLLPSVAFLGPAFATLISGSFVVETIFQIPGMGRHFIDATIDRDEFLLLGCVLYYGFLIVLLNLVADIIQAILNPRLRESL
ncbi:MAG: ABC transporter permease [Akkermansiaceae bacterium]|nr:ABC transporter permease [Akkermansiaceae bacterium]NNM28882.1 ABC transporter permease [Akkermansiaceae bacterium]